MYDGAMTGLISSVAVVVSALQRHMYVHKGWSTNSNTEKVTGAKYLQARALSTAYSLGSALLKQRLF